MDTKEQELKFIRENKIEPYPEKANRDISISEFLNQFSKFQKNKNFFWLVGRIMGIRTHGGVLFIDLIDEKGKIQLVFNEKKTKDYELIEKILGLGDFISVKGIAFLPKTEQKSLLIKEWILISKSLKNFPKEYYKVKDEELLSRAPYLKTIFYKENREVFEKRFKILENLRKILWREGFLEVETPIVQTHYGGALAQPFTTKLKSLNQNLFLRIAPEIDLKKMIIGGFEKIFEIGKNFRNEGIDREHNPEFTMMELYWAYQNREGLMDFTQKIIQELVKEINHSEVLEFQEHKINFGDKNKKWKRVVYADLIKEKTGLDYFKNSLEDFVSLAKKLEIETNPKIITKGKIVDEIFKKTIRPKMIEPVFLIDHPKEISPLAKINPEDDRITLRFQPYIGGLEVGNGFAELNDPIDQKERFLANSELFEKGDVEAHPFDETFIEALEYGMPPTAGLGLGLERLIMLLTNQSNMRDIIYFPFIKS